METKMSVKIKWAIALLLIRILSAFSVGGDTARMLGLSHDYAYYFVFSALYEQIPTIAAVILIFYNHKQPKTENTGFTLMQKWIFALVWVQQAYAFIAFALANSLSSIWPKMLGSCVWLALITWLIYSDWKKTNKSTIENSPAKTQSAKQSTDNTQTDTNENIDTINPLDENKAPYNNIKSERAIPVILILAVFFISLLIFLLTQ